MGGNLDSEDAYQTEERGLEPRISCIIPVYNGSAYLAEAIESALAQTMSDLEIVVVDDGSSDDSAKVAAEFATRGVRVLSQANRGCSAARNYGIRETRGEFVAFLDADDLWLPNKLDTQLQEFNARPELGSSNCMSQNFWMPGFEEEAKANPQLCRPMPGAASSIIIRRASFERIGLLDESKPSRDFQDWFARLQSAGGVHTTLDRVLVRRRVHGSNMSRTSGYAASELLDIAAQLVKARRQRSAASSS